MPDVNLMWIGNHSQFDPSPTTNITQAQANAIIGTTAEGRSQIAPVTLTGTTSSITVNGAPTQAFSTTYQNPTSNFTYTSPSTGQVVTNAHITTFVAASYRITIHDQDGTAHDVVRNGIFIQMSNGDMFFRPALTTIHEWDDITRLSRIEVLGATAQTDSTYPATIGFNSSIYETEIVCFTRGTLIESAEGMKAIESLRIGDLVLTLDRGLQPLRWIGSRKLSAELADQPRLRPIRIRAGALGEGIPQSDLLVSPQHRMLVRSKIARRLFGTEEVLVAAKQLLVLDGVEVADDLAQVEYFHFAFDHHEVVLANGAEAESLYPGAQALKALAPAAREEILTIFPELRDESAAVVTVRDVLAGRDARKLAARHHEKRRPLVSPIN